MIDRKNRDRLAEFVRHLAAGRISTDSFADSAAFALDSADSGVRAVYETADSLYDDVWPPWPYRFRGRRKLAADIRRKLAIASMFLYTDYEYEWPNESASGGGADCLLMILCGSLMTAGGILTSLFPLGVLFPIVGISCFCLAAYVYFYSHRLVKTQYMRWVGVQNQIGDFDVWPFLREADFLQATKTPRLLAG